MERQFKPALPAEAGVGRADSSEEVTTNRKTPMGRFSEVRLRPMAFAIGYGGQWPWWEILVSRRKKLGGTSLDRWCRVSTLRCERHIEKT